MRSFCFVAVSLALFLLVTVQAVAQVSIGWQTDAALATKKTDYFALLKANNIDSDRQGVEKFFDNYYFSRWTLPGATGSVRGYALELLTQDFIDLTGGARDYLLNKSFDTLRKMAADQTVTQAARYNAIYTIGLLNQRDAPNNTTRPVPYAPALEFLVKEYEKQDVNPDFIRLGALLGMYRHALLDIVDVEMRETTLPTLMKKIVEDGKPADRTADEQELLDCFRLRALDTLGALKSTGPRNEVVRLFLGVMENDQESLDVRCYASRKLADLNFQAATQAGIQIDFQRIATALLELTKATCDIELKLVDAARTKEKAKTGIGGIGGIGDPFLGRSDVDPVLAPMSVETQHEVTSVIQRIKSEFTDINWGIRGNQFSGATTVGILPMLPSDDLFASKLSDTSKAISLLFKFLDEGPTETPALPGSRPAGPGAGPGVRPGTGPGTGPGVRPGTGPGAGPGVRPGTGPGVRPGTASDPRALKVNLGLIREKLQEFGETINEIIVEDKS